MKIGSLLKYSLYLIIMILVTFLMLTVYLYFFSNNQSIEMGYSILIPLCIFITSLLYARSTHERGLIRGVEIWVVYFAVVSLFRLLLNNSTDMSMLMHLIYLPISILGGVIGVNLKK
ncbi:putative membrane protein (TIGR04086 family) [Sedimentibacter acidaminivorans]|uniref:Membrane protein (TIGR04086 family) n=1 Tax=Sedimentibacter acidaminivorans TaxID=913099 RepID=A0ABS4GBF5_9FIRM|nr:TIGR04086 family membrane protein [Sedimentibacter acidaminivorans]MBP1925015.1 putative membrane protein (TIGR04086 family) [Sedimentibacter acidaminivorans]